ncbi:MAG: hypothetical protein EU551_02365 [Promethearchaeota archaeon]|nr:MAG: hypothetical protein EU551_02365 [Candidatus Lokiarchaeota archaeon]
MTSPLIIDLDLLETDLPIRSIAEKEDEWWEEFKNEIELRKYKINEFDGDKINLDRRVFKRIQINKAKNKKDVWLHLDYKSQPLFIPFNLLIILFTLGLVIFIIFSILSSIITIDFFYFTNFMIYLTPTIVDIGYMFVFIFVLNQLATKFNPTMYYQRRKKHTHVIKKAAQQSSDKIKRKYLPNLYKYEKIKLGKCPGCNEKIEKSWERCPLCGEDLETNNLKIPENFIVEPLIKPFISYQFYQRKININDIPENFRKFKEVFFNEMKMRDFNFLQEKNNIWVFEKENLLKIKILYKINDDNIDLTSKVGISLRFIVFLLIGIFAFIGLHFSINYFLKFFGPTDTFFNIFNSFSWLLFLFVIGVYIMVLFISFRSYDLPNFPTIRQSIQRAIDYSIKTIKPKYDTAIPINKCPSCKRIIRPHWKVCGYCGYRIKKD